MTLHPSQPEPHRSFFNTDEAYSQAMATYRVHEARRQRSVNISAYVHASIAVAMFSAVAFMIWHMVALYFRAYPV